MTTVFVALGSNLDNPRRQIERAISALAKHPQLHRVEISPLYSSQAIGPGAQPDYCNAVAQLDTDLKPEPLLDLLQAQEDQQGRVRTERWGPRTLDLDIVLYGQRSVHSARLSIPHPRLHERAFVLLPLADLTGNQLLIKGKTVSQLLEKCTDHGMVKRLEV